MEESFIILYSIMVYDNQASEGALSDAKSERSLTALIMALSRSQIPNATYA